VTACGCSVGRAPGRGTRVAWSRAEDFVIIPAPVSGVVIERLATVGDYVETGQPIYRLVDLSRLWAQLEVYESDLQWLAVGQKAVFQHPELPR
jgi:membrane fusion protein, copper/silver efflux system